MLERESADITFLYDYDIRSISHNLKQSISINELLKLESFQKTTITSGTDLTKKISNVTVIEVENFVTWIKGGELGLTTLEKFPNTAKQKWLIDRFTENGGVCLACHPANQSISLTPAAIQYGNEKGLVILSLPVDIPYVDIFESVFGRIVEKQENALIKSNNIRTHLIESILEGGDIQQVTRILYKLLKNPVLITDINLSPLSKKYPSNHKKEKINQLFKKIIDNNKLLLSGLKSHSIRVFSISLNNSHYRFVVYPIFLEGKLVRYLIVLELDHTFEETDYLVLWNAIPVLSLDAMKEKIRNDTTNRMREELLIDLLENKIRNIELADKRFSELGISINELKFVILLKITDMEELYLNNVIQSGYSIQDLKKQIESICQQVSQEKGIPILSMWKSNELLIFPLELNIKKGYTLAEIIYDIANSKIKSNDIVIGVGDYSQNPIELGRSYEEAREAIQTGEKLSFQYQSLRKIFYFNELGFYQLFVNLYSDNHYLKKFCKRLKPIIDYDYKNSSDLLMTLEVFLDNNQNFVKSSQHLYVHVNTVKYRINKIEEILGFSLFNNNKECFNMHVAVKAYKII